jgi:ABC-2 type transport system permease protein
VRHGVAVLGSISTACVALADGGRAVREGGALTAKEELCSRRRNVRLCYVSTMVSVRGMRAFPALLRVGLLESVAYRAEMIVWVLTTTMPLIMLAIFSAAAREAPVGRYGTGQLGAYFLSTFIVRQLTSSWVSWQINMDVRDGTLGTRLLRPVHPLLGYAADSLASTPMRAFVAIPVAVLLLVVLGAHELSGDVVVWLLWIVSIVGAWTISFCVSCAIGALAFFMESSTKVMDIWLAMFFVLSGALVPVDLFPPRLRGALDWLPFRYQIGLPVELMTGAHGRAEALALVGRQWIFVAIALTTMIWAWRKGIGRFAAYGG